MVRSLDNKRVTIAVQVENVIGTMCHKQIFYVLLQLYHVALVGSRTDNGWIVHALRFLW